MVNLALLWHMHQPFYEDLATGEHILPWVRLHAIKDYWGMVALMGEFPGVRATFNLVPSLVVQVQAFAEDRASDRHLAAGLKPAEALTADEAGWLVANGFHAPYGRMIAPYPRYAELHAARLAGAAFTPADLRDLQVWHKLAWIDPDWLARDPRLVELIARDRDYTEADKVALRQIELELLRLVVPAYREAGERGQVELACSPFYHPILPLLHDSDVGLGTHPGAGRPRTRFARPDDARTQIERALAFHADTFGRRPAGMWPSEGSVSDAAVALLAESGVTWIATDEDILARSLGVALPRDEFGHALRPEILYRPYRLGAAGPVALFRDHALSDRIGFHYQSWDAGAAAADFVDRVRTAGHRFAAATGGEVGTVSVILDGENAWEHYPGGGRPFLRALYSALAAAGDIRTVTMAEAASGPAVPLASVHAGSWINADFYIWMGHRDDHRAWSQLAEARDTFDRHAGGVAADRRDQAFEELLIAEGSDWFWWYGDDHSSDHDQEFDELFRLHLRNAYAALGVPVPDELYVSNISTGAATELSPAGVVSVRLDGRATSYLEWAGASRPSLVRPAGAMHEVAAASPITELLVGFDASAGLCLRLAGPVVGLLSSGSATLVVLVSAPDTRQVPVEPAWQSVDELAEVIIPIDEFEVLRGQRLEFRLQVRARTNDVLDTVPAGGPWTVIVPGPGSATSDWHL
ncbi:MAG: glycoside hydrolase family 57 protein [Acidobacteriota bacterium]|nr:glycoside hydrolase family 57 protein [Acidobacteriota bacterium]